MKCTLLNDEQMVNPVLATAVDKTGIQPLLTIPAGTELDHKDAWTLCSIGKAVPADDECRERLLKFQGHPARLAMIANIRALRASDGVKQIDAKSRKWLEYMEKAYAKELGISEAGAE
jgi:hypothetical protein